MIFKNKIFYVSLLVFSLYSCKEITSKDITTKDGLYVYKEDETLVNGSINDYFDNGRLSCTLHLENGIPSSYISYGYQREIIATSKFTIILKTNDEIWQKNKIARLSISNDKEGDYETTDLCIVLKQQLTLNYPELAQQILQLDKKYGFDSKKIDKVYFGLGEIGPSYLYEMKVEK